MNRCTELDDILCKLVTRQPVEPRWISRSYRTQMSRSRLCLCFVLRLPADAWICIMTTSRNLSNYKVKVTWVFLCFLCVHDAAATRGRYLALSKTWRSYFILYSCTNANPISVLLAYGAIKQNTTFLQRIAIKVAPHLTVVTSDADARVAQWLSG